MYELFTTSTHQNCPFRQIQTTLGNSSQPWATPLIRHLSSKKKRLHNRTRRSDLVKNWEKYHAVKNSCRKSAEKLTVGAYVICLILTLIEVTRIYGSGGSRKFSEGVSDSTQFQPICKSKTKKKKKKRSQPAVQCYNCDFKD